MTAHTTFCSNEDHDGVMVPTTRFIEAKLPEGDTSGQAVKIHSSRCDYCAEGKVAVLLRRGYVVTITPVAPAVTA